MYIGESFLFCKKRCWGISIECGTESVLQIVWNLEENAIFCAYDGYNQQTIHTFVKAIVLILFIFAFSGSFAKKKEKKGSKKVF